ncbi:hypothetical protein IE53DRAFT_200376 [Violaceomyces palustris]|uniref:Uncharacterized protein n=1 Tax=Violaceomyces palustris TaxID=1673888 RepID=A0ACD0NRF8_9BASI|nr:hypothetical protein IE53DRAFT_200376 [Violaceomyces palustris]
MVATSRATSAKLKRNSTCDEDSTKCDPRIAVRKTMGSPPASGSIHYSQRDSLSSESEGGGLHVDAQQGGEKVRRILANLHAEREDDMHSSSDEGLSRRLTVEENERKSHAKVKSNTAAKALTSHSQPITEARAFSASSQAPNFQLEAAERPSSIARRLSLRDSAKVSSLVWPMPPSRESYQSTIRRRSMLAKPPATGSVQEARISGGKQAGPSVVAASSTNKQARSPLTMTPGQFEDAIQDLGLASTLYEWGWEQSEQHSDILSSVRRDVGSIQASSPVASALGKRDGSPLLSRSMLGQLSPPASPPTPKSPESEQLDLHLRSAAEALEELRESVMARPQQAYDPVSALRRSASAAKARRLSGVTLGSFGTTIAKDANKVLRSPLAGDEQLPSPFLTPRESPSVRSWRTEYRRLRRQSLLGVKEEDPNARLLRRGASTKAEIQDTPGRGYEAIAEGHEGESDKRLSRRRDQRKADTTADLSYENLELHSSAQNPRSLSVSSSHSTEADENRSTASDAAASLKRDKLQNMGDGVGLGLLGMDTQEEDQLDHVVDARDISGSLAESHDAASPSGGSTSETGARAPAALASVPSSSPQLEAERSKGMLAHYVAPQKRLLEVKADHLVERHWNWTSTSQSQSQSPKQTWSTSDAKKQAPSSSSTSYPWPCPPTSTSMAKSWTSALAAASVETGSPQLVGSPTLGASGSAQNSPMLTQTPTMASASDSPMVTQSADFSSSNATTASASGGAAHRAAGFESNPTEGAGQHNHASHTSTNNAAVGTLIAASAVGSVILIGALVWALFLRKKRSKRRKHLQNVLNNFGAGGDGSSPRSGSPGSRDGSLDLAEKAMYNFSNASNRTIGGVDEVNSDRPANGAPAGNPGIASESFFKVQQRLSTSGKSGRLSVVTPWFLGRKDGPDDGSDMARAPRMSTDLARSGIVSTQLTPQKDATFSWQHPTLSIPPAAARALVTGHYVKKRSTLPAKARVPVPPFLPAPASLSTISNADKGVDAEVEGSVSGHTVTAYTSSSCVDPDMETNAGDESVGTVGSVPSAENPEQRKSWLQLVMDGASSKLLYSTPPRGRSPVNPRPPPPSLSTISSPSSVAKSILQRGGKSSESSFSDTSAEVRFVTGKTVGPEVAPVSSVSPHEAFILASQMARTTPFQIDGHSSGSSDSESRPLPTSQTFSRRNSQGANGAAKVMGPRASLVFKSTLPPCREDSKENLAFQADGRNAFSSERVRMIAGQGDGIIEDSSEDESRAGYEAGTETEVEPRRISLSHQQQKHITIVQGGQINSGPMVHKRAPRLPPMLVPSITLTLDDDTFGLVERPLSIVSSGDSSTDVETSSQSEAAITPLRILTKVIATSTSATTGYSANQSHSTSIASSEDLGCQEEPMMNEAQIGYVLEKENQARIDELIEAGSMNASSSLGSSSSSHSSTSSSSTDDYGTSTTDSETEVEDEPSLGGGGRTSRSSNKSGGRSGSRSSPKTPSHKNNFNLANHHGKMMTHHPHHHHQNFSVRRNSVVVVVPSQDAPNGWSTDDDDDEERSGGGGYGSDSAEGCLELSDFPTLPSWTPMEKAHSKPPATSNGVNPKAIQNSAAAAKAAQSVIANGRSRTRRPSHGR